jgi:hypothetical protein
MTRDDRTWFDKLIFDRHWHQLLKPHHRGALTAYTLPISPWLFFGTAIVVGAVVGIAS